jgi:hypothetical protein
MVILSGAFVLINELFVADLGFIGGIISLSRPYSAAFDWRALICMPQPKKRPISPVCRFQPMLWQSRSYIWFSYEVFWQLRQFQDYSAGGNSLSFLMVSNIRLPPTGKLVS